MNRETEVLIVGAGPTGLMMACQLLRFGVKFILIDKNEDRSQESRAFGIQARSMEIFQNLGIVNTFLSRCKVAEKVRFYIEGKLKLELNFKKIHLKNTSFPNIFFLPQFETEQILIEYIESHGGAVIRKTALESFSQTEKEVKASIKNLVTGDVQQVICQYIVGCDGAHSAVRQILKIPFVGGQYHQNFFLADTKVNGLNSDGAGFMVFLDRAGFFLHIPLNANISRIIGADMRRSVQKTDKPVTIAEIETLSRKIVHKPIVIENPVWMTRFNLHHRVVNQYQKGRAFLAGDAAHIHSPVGAQGMNTGLQDAENLAWKIAAVLKNNMTKSLLDTYQSERQWVGEKLTHTTDRFFWFLTSPNKLLNFIRPKVLSGMLFIIGRSYYLQHRLFLLMSQLAIRYRENPFLVGPKSGSRAPDAPIGETTLFELLKKSPCAVLIFQNQKIDHIHLNHISNLENTFKDWIKVHLFYYLPENKNIFERYQVSQSGLFFIRPDRYIGFHSESLDFDGLSHFLKAYQAVS